MKFIRIEKYNVEELREEVPALSRLFHMLYHHNTKTTTKLYTAIPVWIEKDIIEVEHLPTNDRILFGPILRKQSQNNSNVFFLYGYKEGPNTALVEKDEWKLTLEAK